MTEALVIPDDTELDIKPIINFEPSAVPSTSQAGALQPAHSGASNSSSSMMDSNMDSSDMTTFAEAGLPSTSGGAAGATPHGMYVAPMRPVADGAGICLGVQGGLTGFRHRH